MKQGEEFAGGAGHLVLPAAVPDQVRTGGRRGPHLPFKVINTYIFWHVAEASVRGFMMFAFLLLMTAVITAVRRLVDQSLAFGSVLEWLAYQLPRILMFTFPMSVLYGVVQAFADLSGRSEITAMMAGGMSLRRLLVAPMAWGAIVMCICMFDQEVLVPHAEQHKYQALANSVSEVMKVQEGFRFEDPPVGRGLIKRLIEADRFDPKNGTMTKPSIQLWNDEHRLYEVISADRATWNLKSGEWDFFNAETITYPNNRQNAAGIISKFQHAVYRAPSPEGLSNATMTFRQHMEHGDYELASMVDLWKYRQSLIHELASGQFEGDRVREQQFIQAVTYGFHDKIATPIVCLCLVLIGVPLGIRPPRTTGSGVAIGLSLLVLLAYYVVWVFTQTVGTGGRGNPVMLAYAHRS